MECILTLLIGIYNLHVRNVLLGDINEFNFLIKDESHISFIDTDSYQIEGYPCPVFRKEFRAPELYGVDFSKTLRTFEHENFAIATLLFMILHHGKQPYAYRGGTTASKNIKCGVFPYPITGKDFTLVPAGNWGYCWDHLWFPVKDAFYDVFKNHNRKSVQEWYTIFSDYKNEIQASRCSDELFPDSFVRSNTPKIVQCFGCGLHIPRSSAHTKKNGNKGLTYLCASCWNQHTHSSRKGLSIRFVQVPPHQKKKGKGLINVKFGNRLLDQFFN